MKMKMKLLDYTLLCVLAGIAPAVSAQDAGLPAPGAVAVDPAAADGVKPAGPAVPDCSGSDECRSDEGLLFRLRTRGERQPVAAAGDGASSAQLQPDRRVTIGMEQPGKATISGKFSVQLDNGGVIWATEDPTLGQPALSVSAPSFVPFDGRAITKPVQFYVRSNYSSFVERYELSLYRASDSDLVEPLAVVPLDVAAVSSSDWSGELPGN
jgi:hypothetical protein